MSATLIPPGLPFLVALLIRLFWAPGLVFYVLTDPSFGLPSWAIVLLSALSIPIAWAIVINIRSWNQQRQAKAMGAVLPPVYKGRWIGNLDILSANLRSAKYGYLGKFEGDAIEATGTTMRFRVLWNNVIFTTEPEHVKIILASDFQNYIKGDRFKKAMDSVLGTGVFNSDGDMWKFHRSMTRPFFSRDRIAHFDIFDRHAEDAIAKMKDRFRAGYPVDFQDLVARFTLDSATEFLFGKDVCSLSSPLPFPYNANISRVDGTAAALSPAERFARAFGAAQDIIANRSRLGDIWRLWEMTSDHTRAHMKVVEGYVEPILKEALERERTRREKGDNAEDMTKASIEEGDDETLLEHLVKYTDDPKVLKDEIINIMVAGRDTTATTMSFTVYFLAMYPHVLQRLRTEILDRIGPMRRPTYEDIREMKYLRAVLNETLRLYPAVPFDVRESINATTWPSPDPFQKPFFIPAKTQVPYSVYLMHRRKDLWGPDAEEFDPERFLDDRLKKYLVPNPFIFVPFNAGPRICLGQQFAYNEMSFMLIRLLQRFSAIELNPSAQDPETRPALEWQQYKGTRMGMERIRPKSHLTVYAKGGVWLKMTEADTGAEAV